MCPIPEAPPDQLGQNSPRADLHEVCDPRGIHRVDHLAKAHGRRELVSQQAATGLRGLGIHLGRLVRINIHRTGPPLHTGQMLMERLTGAGHDAAVERRRYREPDRP